MTSRFRVVAAACGLLVSLSAIWGAEPLFRAGAAVVDISPPAYPVLVNAMFTERTATSLVDPLNARALVLDDGTNRLAIAVVDTCMMPRSLIDHAKELARGKTKISPQRMLISATHTHSAPSAMGCLGSRVDTNYAGFLPGRIAEAISLANERLEPAEIGWGKIEAWEHTFNRRWIRRPDRLLEDPFGQQTVRAHMHPGHESPDAIGPSGPVDPELSFVAFRARTGRPLALLANYSQHYYGSSLLSSDYFGRFAEHIAKLLGATNNNDTFVGIMSQGTSGDLMWMDYGAPRKEIGYDNYAREIASLVHENYQRVRFSNWVPLRIAEQKLTLKYRTPNLGRLEWARKVVAELKGRLPQSLPEIYALEAIYLHESQKTELVLQAVRIGDVGITAIPNEVYALTGLKLKAQSPFPFTFNIELANGAEGYIPPPEQHRLGGYTTWPARTAGLEEEGEPRIVETLLQLLEEASGKPRRKIVTLHGPYARKIIEAKPTAYWRFEEMEGGTANDSSRRAIDAKYEGGVTFYLPGPGSGEGVTPKPALKTSSFSGTASINRAVHFAGGRLQVELNLAENYTVEMWFWNGLPSSVRPVTGYLFSRGSDSDPEVNGDHLGIGGTATPNAEGKLILFNGNKRNELAVGKTVIPLKKWHHVAMVRRGNEVICFLNGALEFSTKISRTAPNVGNIFVGGRSDGFANFEGKLDEVAIYDRELSLAEILNHYQAASTE